MKMHNFSNIALLNSDNTIEMSYISEDNDVYEKALLYTYYNNPEIVKKLISLGNIYSLQKQLEPQSNLPHNQSSPQTDVTVFYIRDVGIHNNKSQYYRDIKDYIGSGNVCENSYLYDIKSEKWFILKVKNTFTGEHSKRKIEKDVFENIELLPYDIKILVEHEKMKMEKLKHAKQLCRELNKKIQHNYMIQSKNKI